MANKDAAFGLKPIAKVGQNPNNGGLSEYSIAANDSSAIYFQDLVKVTAAGTIDVAATNVGNLAGSLNGVFTLTQLVKSLRGQITMQVVLILLI
jgi:hypothetical protein